MSDLRSLLDEASADLTPAGDEYAATIGLAARRTRRARRQRLVAAAVAIVIAAAGISLAVGTFGPRAGRPAGQPPYGNGPIGFVGFTSNAPFGITGDLYTVNSDGSGLTRLTRSGDVTVDVHFSPDGRKVLSARSPGEGDWTIAVMNADGSDRRQLTGGEAGSASSATDEFPSWIAGGRIAFVRNTGGRAAQGIWIMNADGSRARLVTPGWVPFEAAFSPDGSRVAWMGNRHTGAGEEDIFVADLDGSHRARLTHDPGTAMMPSWSPDGARLAFVNSGTIQVIDSDGSGRRTIYRCDRPCAGGQWPTWSPDGREIAFTVSSMQPPFSRTKWTDLFVVRTDGSDLHRVIRLPFIACCPTWQPIGPAGGDSGR